MRATPRVLRSLALSTVAAAATVTMAATPAVAAPGGHGHGKVKTSGGTTTSPSTATGPATYQDFAFTSKATAPTADKPQSKLWFADGSWWSLMLSPADGAFHIFELRTDHTWRDTGTVVDTRVTSTGDALWDGSHLYVASRNDFTGLKIFRFSYSSTTRTWSGDSGFPVLVDSAGMESATIAEDSAGWLWVTYTQNSTVYVAHTTGNDAVWGAPYVVPVADTSITSDDISAIIHFGHSIGVMWSNQNTGTFDFAVHPDGAGDASWTREVALSGPSMSDDHINLKSIVVGPDEKVYAAVKTSKNDAGAGSAAPIVEVLARSATGSWSAVTAATVGDIWTRPQLLIDSGTSTLYIFATAPETGGTIYYKSSPLSSLSFPNGKGAPFMTWSGAAINNVSTTKQTVDATTGIVAIAADSSAHLYYHAELALPPASTTADTQAPTAAALTATAGSPTSVGLTWTAASDNVGVAGYDVYRGTTKIASVPASTRTYTDSGLSPSTTYSYTVTAFDAAGNRTPSNVATATTPASPPAGSGITLVGTATAANGNATSVAVSRPSGGSAGDVLVAALAIRGSKIPAAPAGWTLAKGVTNGSVIVLATYTHVTAATEPASYTFPLGYKETAVASLAEYAGVDTADPVDVAGGSANPVQKGIAAPSVSPSGATDLLVGVFATATSTTITAPSAMSDTSDVSSPATTYKISLQLAQQPLSAAGATGTRTATAAGSAANDGQLVALRPAP